ncbi:ATP-binding protein [Embleya sp. NPDC050493]|uniref:ATP-binding protein n=1 Tax=Embleya sp. NPDC050493 TaxID=3363989 RepID=UPI00378A1B98
MITSTSLQSAHEHRRIEPLRSSPLVILKLLCATGSFEPDRPNLKGTVVPSDASVCLDRSAGCVRKPCFLSLMPGEDRPVRRARKCVLAACHQWQIAGDVLVLVMVELLTNAYTHARLTPGGQVLVRVHWRKQANEFVLEVVVPQPRFDLPEAAVSDPHAESGRGLAMVRELSREFSCEERTPGFQTFTVVLAAA